MLDYKQNGILTQSPHVLLMTPQEFETINNCDKGFTKDHNNFIAKRWVIRHNTLFPVEILRQH